MATAMPLGQIQAGAKAEAGILNPMAPGICPTHFTLTPIRWFRFIFGFSGSSSGLSSPQAGSNAIFHVGLFFGAFFFGSDSVEFFQCLSSQLSLALYLLFLFISYYFFFVLSVTKLAWTAVAVAVSAALLPPRCWRRCWRRQNASESAVLVSFKNY